MTYHFPRESFGLVRPAMPAELPYAAVSQTEKQFPGLEVCRALHLPLLERTIIDTVFHEFGGLHGKNLGKIAKEVLKSCHNTRRKIIEAPVSGINVVPIEDGKRQIQIGIVDEVGTLEEEKANLLRGVRKEFGDMPVERTPLDPIIPVAEMKHDHDPAKVLASLGLGGLKRVSLASISTFPRV